MENTNRVHRSGYALIAGSLLWVAAILVEYGFGLKPPSSGTLYYLNQAMFFVAEAGWVTGIFGLIWARAAGSGAFGKIALGIFAFGWITLVVAIPVGIIAGSQDIALYPLGGLTSMLGGLLAGAAVVAARRWQGWQRFSVLFYALYYFLVLMLPLFLTGQAGGPTMVTEVLWGLAWLPMGYALVTTAHSRALSPSGEAFLTGSAK